jgi:hypothetical protein
MLLFHFRNSFYVLFIQVVINSSVNIIDNPRFRHRGAMLDTARHFLPVSIIKKNLVNFVELSNELFQSIFS